MTEDVTSPVRELVIPDPSSSVRWHQHDWPHPLARWHYHPEVEVHLIRESSGTVMAGDWAEPFDLRRLSAVAELLGLLAESPEAERRYLHSHGGSYRLDAVEAEVFNRALSYITEHLDGRMLVPEVAEAVGLSRDAFSRLFSKATGVGFNRTATRMRLTEACRLLRGTDLPVSDICYRVGFTNLSNFNRHFRATTGTTPSRYRRIDQL